MRTNFSHIDKERPQPLIEATILPYEQSTGLMINNAISNNKRCNLRPHWIFHRVIAPNSNSLHSKFKIQNAIRLFIERILFSFIHKKMRHKNCGDIRLNLIF